MEFHKVYGLYDPRTDELRYVGKTHGKLNDRLSSHIFESREHKNKRACWIKSLTKLNLRPVIKLIQETEDYLVDLLEMHYIEYYKSIGCKLTNMQPGGDGQPKGYEFKKRFTWGKNDPRNDAKHLKSPENTAKQREAMKALRGVKRPNYKPNPVYKKVFLYCIKTGEVLEFKSGKDAAEYLGVYQGNIVGSAKGVNRQTKGYYAAYTKKEALEKHKLINQSAPGKKRPVTLVKSNGEILEFNSFLEAARQLGIKRDTIYDYINKYCKKVDGKFYVKY
jgi:hypothetical protein